MIFVCTKYDCFFILHKYRERLRQNLIKAKSLNFAHYFCLFFEEATQSLNAQSLRFCSDIIGEIRSKFTEFRELKTKFTTSSVSFHYLINMNG